MVRKKKLSNTTIIAANQVIDLLIAKKIDKAKQIVKKNFNRGSELWLFFNGWIHQLQGEHYKAIQLFEKALLVNPVNVDLLLGLSGSYLELNQYDRAIECAQQANLIEKNNPKILLTWATCLSKSNKKNKTIQQQADTLFTNAFNLASEPIHYQKELMVDILASWGGVLLNLNQLHQAVIVLEKAIQLDPYNTIANKNLVSVYANLNMLDKAIACSRIACMSDDVNLRIDTLYQEGMLELLRGNYARGWRLHENRLFSSRYKYKNLALHKDLIPLTQLNNSHKVLIFQEQGIGDLINFSHLIPKVYAMCPNIDLMVLPNSFLPINDEIPSPKKIMEHNYGKYINKVLVYSVDKIDASDYDCVVSLMSLPGFFGIGHKCEFELSDFSSPASTPVQADIGIFWKGSMHHDNDDQRSLEVKYINALVRDNPDKSFVCLQIDRLEGLEQHPNLIIDAQSIAGLENLASTISNCKLVITVDSMVAHLAGSLKRPTWILQAYSPDWRWGLESTENIWYPTMRSFRQSKLDSWDSVIESVSSELKRVKI